MERKKCHNLLTKFAYIINQQQQQQQLQQKIENENKRKRFI